MKQRPLSLCIALLVLSGCASTSPPEPGVYTPGSWRYSASATQAPLPDAVTASWWKNLGSDELNRLVQQAATGSFDVAAAVARVAQARAQSRIAGAALLPGVTAFADADRQNGLLVSNADSNNTGFDLGIAASYELDFWGRNRSVHDASVARLNASVFDRDTVTLTVTSDVASMWLQTVSLRERGSVARRTLATAQRILATIDSRRRAGAATALELAQQRGLAAAGKRTAAALEQQANDAEASLALLLGETPSRFHVVTTSLDDLRVPSSLMTRRPDLASAEAQLRAAHADIAVARAAMLPSVTLTGPVGLGSERLRSLFDNPVYSVAAGLTAPIFNAGSLAAGRDLAVARQEELLAVYRKAIVAAFGDVELSLNAAAGVDAQRIAQDEELAQARRALVLAESRYRAGAETLLVVLDAQQTLYAAEDEAVQLRLARLQASVALFRALGGGWSEATG